MSIPAVAVYFPQFHPIPENDQFWGEGFTEWTYLNQVEKNRVGEVLRKPRPGEMYNALDYETRKRQGEQARHAGISAFAYYHYWTQDRPVMDRVLHAMLDDGEPNVQHCLIWANISWTKKWDGLSEVLLHQTYAMNETGWELHYQFLKPFWTSPRAFRINNAVVFAIYHPSDIGWDRFNSMMVFFRKRFKEDTDQALHIITFDNTFHWNQGYHHHGQTDAVLLFEPMSSRSQHFLDPFLRKQLDRRPDRMGETTETYPYWETVTAAVMYGKKRNPDKEVYLTAVAGWDNTARYEAQGRTSRLLATTWSGFTPELFETHLKHVLRTAPLYAKTPVLFLNAWNEWNEQAVLEPCSKFGTQLLDICHKHFVLKENISKEIISKEIMLDNIISNEIISKKIELPSVSLTKLVVLVFSCGAIQKRPRSDSDETMVSHFDWYAQHDKLVHFEFRQVSAEAPITREEIFFKMQTWKPHLILTIGPHSPELFVLQHMPFAVRRMWLHWTTWYEIHPVAIEAAIQGTMFHHPLDPTHPLLSIVTTSYKSGDRILRPFLSLLRQPYCHWEWIIVLDDDDDTSFAQLMELQRRDFRIRLYRPAIRAGRIGEAKRDAFMLARGKVLIELDHDDELTDHCLEWIRDAYLKYPSAGMYYTETVEPEEITDKCSDYGEYYAFGYGTSYKFRPSPSWGPRTPSWRTSLVNKPPNCITLRHIVGVPNHVRAWNAEVYRSLGGHRTDFSVADDYELIVRTYVKAKFCRIVGCGYIQFRNVGHNNHTNIRNALIQRLTAIASRTHYNAIQNAFADHPNALAKALPPPQLQPHPLWGRPPLPWLNWKPNNDPDTEFVYDPDASSGKIMFDIIMPTYNRSELLIRAIRSVMSQQYKHWRLWIIGDACPTLERTMVYIENEVDARVRYWNLQTNRGAGGAAPRNYALMQLADSEWIAYLDDDNCWAPDHLSSAVETINQYPESQYILTSFRVCKDQRDLHGPVLHSCFPEKGRIDTSAVLHRRSLLKKYGYWKDRTEGGYAHDWEFVSRFAFTERFMFTCKPTMLYNTETNGQTYESILFLPESGGLDQAMLHQIIQDNKEFQSTFYSEFMSTQELTIHLPRWKTFLQTLLRQSVGNIDAFEPSPLIVQIE